MTGFFDVHAHYYDDKFGELDGGADALLRELFSSSVDYVLNASTSSADMPLVANLTARFDGCYAAYGIHPEECGKEESLEKALSILETYLKKEKAVAIGEIGLDYHWAENPPRDLQRAFFEAQLSLARQKGLPTVIHARDAHGDTYDILKRFDDVPAVLHCYSGSPEMARQYLKNDLRYISFGGVLTYKNAVQTVETAKLVPLSRILLETDCPYLAPVPYRGKINHSGYMVKVAEKLAEIKGVSVDEIANITKDNAKNLFSVK